MTPVCRSRSVLSAPWARRGYTFIELMIVVAVMVAIAGMAIPAFGATLARSRIQTNASNMVQDLQLVRNSAIAYQQDLYVYICTSPASSGTVYYYELFQKDPTNLTESSRHYTPADAPVAGRFERKVASYNMAFGLPVQSGSAYSFTAATVDAKQYLVLAYCCGRGSNFRGQPVVVSNVSATPPTYVAFSSAIGIPVVDAANARTWYVAISPTGRASSTPMSP
jgi:prepilin-type N-terminal cleavage/methylation domain-containing protein